MKMVSVSSIQKIERHVLPLDPVDLNFLTIGFISFLFGMATI